MWSNWLKEDRVKLKVMVVAASVKENKS